MKESKSLNFVSWLPANLQFAITKNPAPIDQQIRGFLLANNTGIAQVFSLCCQNCIVGLQERLWTVWSSQEEECLPRPISSSFNICWQFGHVQWCTRHCSTCHRWLYQCRGPWLFIISAKMKRECVVVMMMVEEGLWVFKNEILHLDNFSFLHFSSPQMIWYDDYWRVILFTRVPGRMNRRDSMVQSNMALLNTFWQSQFQLLETGEPDFKNYQLPLARIKKVMKTDDDVHPMVYIFSLSLSDFAW